MDMALNIIENVIDVEFSDGDYVGDEGLETAILISLFTDQRATEDEIKNIDISKRGYWGDLFPDVEGDEIGSKLWLYGRSKVTADNLTKIQSDAVASLQWLVDDGVASEVTVEVELVDSESIYLGITIVKPSGEDNKFGIIWNQQGIKRA